MNRRKQHLGVGRATERHPAATQRLTKFLVVVQLPIESQHVAAAPTHHGLPSGRRQIQNRQPAMSQANALRLVGPDVLVVRTPMGERAGHRLRDAAGDPCVSKHTPAIPHTTRTPQLAQCTTACQVKADAVRTLVNPACLGGESA